MPRKQIARCVGNRHVEVSRLVNGNLLIELKWKNTTTLCGLIFQPEEAKKLLAAVESAVKT